MAEILHFRISSGLKNIIGRELINDKYIAIFELVKNSYDAGAKYARIRFDNLGTSEATKKTLLKNGFLLHIPKSGIHHIAIILNALLPGLKALAAFLVIAWASMSAYRLKLRRNVFCIASLFHGVILRKTP